MLNYMLQTANPKSTFKERLKKILKEYGRVISLNAMGFPAAWEEEKMWSIGSYR